MQAFVSHNKADKATARLLATALVEVGVGVWYDEWDIRPGDSIIGGIEEGLSTCNAFILIWSSYAQKSNWVGAELRAAITRRVADKSLRVIPIMVDDTPLPVLVSEYRGFALQSSSDLRRIATEISGVTNYKDIAQTLQRRLHELADLNNAADNPVRVVV